MGGALAGAAGELPSGAWNGRRSRPGVGTVAMMGVPDELSWLFWDVDPWALDAERDAYTVLTRVLEQGRL